MGIQVKPEDILLEQRNGRLTGIALVRVHNQLDQDFILDKNNQRLMGRYIEVFPSTEVEFSKIYNYNHDIQNNQEVGSS